MIPYLSIYLFLALLGAGVRQKQARPLLPIILGFLLVFMGTRFYVGCDFGSYLKRFVDAATFAGEWSEIFQDEAGFSLLVTSIKDAGLDFMWLNLACAMIFVTCTWIFCNSHPRPLITLALLFPVFFIQLGMSGIRQGTAAALLMLATVHFVKRRRALTALTIIVASLFHTSAIVFLPIALMVGRDVTGLKIIMSVLLLTPVAAVLLGSRADVYVDRYVDDVYGELSAGGAYVRYMLVLVPALLFMRYRDRIREAYPQVHGLLQLFALIIFALAPVGAVNTVVLHRLNYYVMPVSILMFVYTALVIARGRAPSFVLPSLMYGIYSLSWFLTSSHAAHCYIPYRSYLGS